MPPIPFPARWVLDAEHVEVIHLDIGATSPGAAETLSEEERARAARFVFERDRGRYVNARAAARQVLGACLGIAASAVRFTYGEHGKPALGSPGPPIRFNLSHSGDRAVVAVALGREVGVDLEGVRDDLDHSGIARGYFTPRERAAIESRTGPERAVAFFRCWVAKESYLKARGDGLSASLSAFEVDGSAHGDALRWSSLDTDGRRWRVVPLPAAAGHVAALACEAGDWRSRHWAGAEGAAGSDLPLAREPDPGG